LTPTASHWARWLHPPTVATMGCWRRPRTPLELFAPLPVGSTVHLDAGYDWQPCRDELARRGLAGQIAQRGIAAPIQAGRRWVIERTHAWGNQNGKLRWCTER
jgi:hypothetical protein